MLKPLSLSINLNFKCYQPQSNVPQSNVFMKYLSNVALFYYMILLSTYSSRQQIFSNKYERIVASCRTPYLFTSILNVSESM